MAYGYWGFRPYVSVAARAAKATREAQRLQKKGQKLEPITLSGRKITTTFWGNAWCEHLEKFSDFANRLPRGRSYVRNGSVIDLKLSGGKITALVMGSELYEIDVKIKPLPAARWSQIKTACAGRVGSMIELLQGKLSDEVMRVVTDRDAGLFPSPDEIELDCSCPDYADLCKHLAAVLFGVGARLDTRPQLLFALRGVDESELIASAGDALAKAPSAGKGKRLEANLVGDVFGVEIDTTPVAQSPAPKPAKPAKPTKARKPAPAIATSPPTRPAAKPKQAAKKPKPLPKKTKPAPKATKPSPNP